MINGDIMELVDELVKTGTPRALACKVIAEAIYIGHLTTPFRHRMVAPDSFPRLRMGAASSPKTTQWRDRSNQN